MLIGAFVVTGLALAGWGLAAWLQHSLELERTRIALMEQWIRKLVADLTAARLEAQELRRHIDAATTAQRALLDVLNAAHADGLTGRCRWCGGGGGHAEGCAVGIAVRRLAAEEAHVAPSNVLS